MLMMSGQRLDVERWSSWWSCLSGEAGKAGKVVSPGPKENVFSAFARRRLLPDVPHPCPGQSTGTSPSSPCCTTSSSVSVFLTTVQEMVVNNLTSHAVTPEKIKVECLGLHAALQCQASH